MVSELETVPPGVTLQIGPFSKDRALELAAIFQGVYPSHIAHPLTKVLCEIFEAYSLLEIAYLLETLESMRPFDTKTFGLSPCSKMQQWVSLLINNW